MQAWRAAVPRSRGRPKSTPFHGADGADALQGIANNGHPFGADGADALQGIGQQRPIRSSQP